MRFPELRWADGPSVGSVSSEKDSYITRTTDGYIAEADTALNLSYEQWRGAVDAEEEDDLE